MKRTLRNDTTSAKAYYNQRNGTFWVLAPGEVLEVEIPELPQVFSTGSNPPAGMQRLVNFYRNPETGRMEIEYQDVPKE